MQDASESHEAVPAVLSVDDVDTEFLPLIYDIIRRYLLFVCSNYFEVRA